MPYLNCFSGCLVCGTALLKLDVVHIHSLQIRRKELDYHIVIAGAINFTA